MTDTECTNGSPTCTPDDPCVICHDADDQGELTMNTAADALAVLRAAITPGWTVDIIDHDYMPDSRSAVRVDRVSADRLILRPALPWSSQGRKYPTMSLTWDSDLVADGYTVRLYRTPPPHTGKSRRVVKTFTFHPPR